MMYLDMDYYHKYRKYKYRYLRLKQNKLIQYAGENIITTEENPQSQHKTMADANNSFTINMFDNLDGASNLFSPISITYALSLIHLAALGNTDNQLTKLFNYKYSVDDLEQIYKLFNNNVIQMTNLLLVNNKYKINKVYVDMISGLVRVIDADFSNSALIVHKINNFIENKTNGLIKNLVDENDIDASMILVLINTIYFKASWQHKFDPDNTTKMKFHKTNLVDMMHQINYFNYFENSTVQAIEILYKKNAYAMGVILPKRYLQEDEIDYSTNDVPLIPISETNEIINNMAYTRIDLYLPKFTQRKNLELVPVLIKMGVTDLFNHRADLTIAVKDAFISKIIHESVVIVDEFGTEAAAATVVMGKITAMPPHAEPEPILFKADHAFVYYIRHLESGMFLFYGDYQGN